MDIIKALHVTCVFIWMGNLLTLTRLLGYHTNEDKHTQLQMAKVYKRMYNFISLPTMILAVVLGMFLMTQLDLKEYYGWFYWKLAFVGGLIACDTVCGRWVAALSEHSLTGKGVKYKILHGVTGLLLIGVIFSIYVLRHKNGV